ncbi:hypothetical protein BDR04DRAFT_1096086 [Suillus decipiens]|nr:hypothetical protein BDR04DRAFT_1096086 [Suillus decipiens]
MGNQANREYLPPGRWYWQKQAISCYTLSGGPTILALVMIRIATISSSHFRGDVSYVASTEVFDIAIVEFASTYIMGH